MSVVSLCPSRPPQLGRPRCPRSLITPRCSTGAKELRAARAEDMRQIQQLVLQEYMNPLGLEASRFLVASDVQGGLLACGQLEPKPSAAKLEFHELRTLIVAKNARGQGLGTSLMRALVERAGSVPVFLTTLKSTIPFYARAGFQEIPLSKAPRALWFEAAAGTIVARLAVNDQLVVLCNKPHLSR